MTILDSTLRFTTKNVARLAVGYTEERKKPQNWQNSCGYRGQMMPRTVQLVSLLRGVCVPLEWFRSHVEKHGEIIEALMLSTVRNSRHLEYWFLLFFLSAERARNNFMEKIPGSRWDSNPIPSEYYSDILPLSHLDPWQSNGKQAYIRSISLEASTGSWNFLQISLTSYTSAGITTC